MCKQDRHVVLEQWDHCELIVASALDDIDAALRLGQVGGCRMELTPRGARDLRDFLNKHFPENAEGAETEAPDA